MLNLFYEVKHDMLLVFNQYSKLSAEKQPKSRSGVRAGSASKKPVAKGKEVVPEVEVFSYSKVEILNDVRTATE